MPANRAFLGSGGFNGTAGRIQWEFAARGGLIILGLSEKNGFKPAAGFDAERTCSALQAAGDKLEPMVRMEVEKVPFEGSVIVVARVPGLSPQEKPCYIRNRGQYEGSFIRSGDGNRQNSSCHGDRFGSLQSGI